MLVWLLLVVAVQCLAWPFAVALGGLLALGGTGLLRRWWKLLRRARWLLLSLFLILAYGAAGEALFDLSWMPTDVGVTEAAIHVLRLVVLLGALAWLFEQLDRPRMLAGIWALVRPLGLVGVDVAPAVVRLALVFELIEEAPPKGSWRQFLADGEPTGNGADHVRLELPPWHIRDTLILGASLLVVAGACWLP